MEHIKILIIDDHPLMREALAFALAEEPDMDVVAQAATADQGLDYYQSLQPDVVLMDLLLPGMGGLEATAALLRHDPGAKVLIITSLEDAPSILAAIQAGALGYFPKSAPRAFLLEAIRRIADNIPYLPAGIMLKLFRYLRENKTAYVRDSLDEPLTGRQQQILALLGEAKSDEEIAQVLNISAATVRTHVHHILQRLGLETRSQAIAYANQSN